MTLRKNRVTRRLSSAIAVVIAVAGLVALTPTAAQAGTVIAWSSNIADIDAYELLSGQDGSVTASRCSTSQSGEVGTRTFSYSGAISGSTPMVDMGNYKTPSLDACDFYKAVDAEGTIYGIDSTAYPLEKLTAYAPSGTQLWSNVITVTNCNGARVMPERVSVGSDGNVYTTGQSNSCGGYWYLTSYAPSGTLRWQVQLSGQSQALVPYIGGVVVASQSSRALYYYGNDGSVITITQIVETGNLAIDGRGYGVDENGVVSLVVQDWMPECPSQNGYTFYGTRYVASYGQNGFVFRHAPPTCTNVGELAASRVGGVSYVLHESDDTWAVVKLDSAGSVVHEMPWSSGPGVVPDTNGNLLAATYYTYLYQGVTLRAMQFELLNPATGSVLAQFSTEAIDGTHNMAVADYAMSSGRLYIVAQTCSSNWYCSASSKYVYAVNFAKMGMDYPRGKVLGVDSAMIDNMAVVGDSFTSGLGSLQAGEQYESGSCGRSPSAYVRLLQGDTSIRLNLADFTACAGAETHHVINQSFQGEEPQAGRISTDAKSVFMTIGGNDVGFGRFSTLCVLYDCTLPAVAQEVSDNFSALSNSDGLGNAYRAVLDRAPNATLYVIGYPQILPLQDCHDSGSAWWQALEAVYQLPPAVLVPMLTGAGLTSTEAAAAALMGGPEITDDELIAGNQLVGQLNLAISDAVMSVNSQPAYAGRIVYVSTTMPGTPLASRKLCSADPAFNGLDLANPGNSFHPNASGQAELYLLARAALAAHQPQYVPFG